MAFTISHTPFAICYLYLQIPPDGDEAGEGAGEDADAQKQNKYLAEVGDVIFAQADAGEKVDDFRVKPKRERIKQNHGDDSREKSVHHPLHHKRPAGEAVAGADQLHNLHFFAR